MVTFGASPYAVERMWQSPGKDISASEKSIVNPLHKALAHLGEDLYRQQLQPGKELNILQSIFLQRIHESICWQNVSQKITVSSSHSRKKVSLLGWCREVLLDAATKSFFGDRLQQIDPDLFQSFFDFDDNSWKLTYHYPRFLSREMYAAKQQAIDALTTYFRLPKEERLGESWLVRTLEAEMRRLDIAEPDIAAFVMMTYWVINANAYKLCFWILAYLLYDRDLLQTIRSEVTPAVQEGTVDLETRLERCPRLEALYNEVIRLTLSSSSVRNVLAPTKIGGKILRPGRKVLMPLRQLHFNKDVYGANVDQFDPERFLKNKNLAQSSSFRPFGGGTTYCPGRFLGRREVITFVALFLCRFEVDLAGPDDRHGSGMKELSGVFPRLEEAKPCLGIMGPVKGDDVYVSVRPAVLT